jgi:hypothetical protein
MSAEFAAPISALTDTATPINGIVDGRRIPEYENSMLQTRCFDDGSRQDLGIWSDEIRVFQKSGGQILQRKLSVDKFDSASWHQEIELDRRTLMPKRVLIHSGEELHNRVLYNGHVIHTTRRMWPEGVCDGTPIMVDMVLSPPEPVFEWQLWELTLAAFPLEPGYSCQFLAHHVHCSAASPLIRVAFVVIGEEWIETRSGETIECWKVALTADNDWTVWIAKDQSRPPVVKNLIHYAGYRDEFTID